MLRRTVLTSYLAQAYISLIGIIFMPLYMRYMGAEAFGLVGFFLMMQSWMQLLDLGMSPTLSREMSLYRAGLLDAAAAWQRLRSIEWFLGLLVLIVVSVLIVFRNWITLFWLTFEGLSTREVAACIAMMAVAAALRWLMGLYRAGLVGLERQLWVNGMGSLFATLKFAGVMPLLAYGSSAPLIFFAYQAVVGIFELLAFVRALYRVLPGAPPTPFPEWNALRSIMPTAGAMAFMSGMWIFFTQIDKLILSRLLSLKEYGYFMLAVMASGGVLILVPPLNQVLQPRMTILVSQGQENDLRDLYQQATQLVTAVFFAIGGTLSLFAEPLLFAWTGDLASARAAAPILFWYGWANALIGLLVLPFMLQFAHGYLRLHVIGNIIMGITLLPLLVFAAIRFGGAGAGAMLFCANLLFMILWVPRVHLRFLPELVFEWLFRNVGQVALPVIGFLSLARCLIPVVEDRVFGVLMIGLVFYPALVFGLLAGDRSRRLLMEKTGG